MASQEATRRLSFKANADLSAKQYLCVKLTAADTVDVCSGITDKTCGILQDTPAAAGRSASVAVEGTSKAIAAAAITAGAFVATDATGKVQTAVSTQYPIGQAIDAAAASGDVIEIRLLSGGVPLP